MFNNLSIANSIIKIANVIIIAFSSNASSIKWYISLFSSIFDKLLLYQTIISNFANRIVAKHTPIDIIVCRMI